MVPPLEIGPLVVDPPILQAPMAGFTNYAYRQVVRRHGGVGLPATEMFSARGFLEIDSRYDRPPERLWGVLDEPRPLATQIWDNNPDLMAEVGRRLAREFHVSVVDINFGCPVTEVTEKAHSGSYLLRYPDRVGQIVSAVAKACAPTPVTAKIRLGQACRDTINACDVGQAVEDAGGAALTVHGRTAADMFRGSADWDEISKIKPSLYRIPLIGNGDITTPQAVVDAFRRYDIDGVMIGRAALNRPWLFQQAAAALRGEPIPPRPIARRAAGIHARTLPTRERAIRRTTRDGAHAKIRLLLCQRPARRQGVPSQREQSLHRRRVPRHRGAILPAPGSDDLNVSKRLEG